MMMLAALTLTCVVMIVVVVVVVVQRQLVFSLSWIDIWEVEEEMIAPIIHRHHTQ